MERQTQPFCRYTFAVDFPNARLLTVTEELEQLLSIGIE